MRYEFVGHFISSNTSFYCITGLVLVGHSLGAAIASILTLMLASPEICTTTFESGLPPFRPVKTYCLAAPCCMNVELSERSRGLITR